MSRSIPETLRAIRCARWRAAAGEERGTALVEFALVGSILMMMVLGVIEYGNLYSAAHTLSSLSREGANLASRGATLQEAVNNVMSNGSDIDLATQGGAIASRIAVRNGTAMVEEQFASTGYANSSRLGAAGGPAQNVQRWGLQEGQIVYAMEILFTYDALTPFEGMFGIGIPDQLYEIGIF
jgi:hypothetical protein